MKKVSVIIPVYNMEKYLERCVTSVRKQTLNEIEIILVDDGSRDYSSYLCDLHAKDDPRIKVIHKENMGVGLARNSGLDMAEGEYVTFIDSDDYIHPETLEKAYAKAKEHDADIVRYGCMKEKSEKGEWIAVIEPNCLLDGKDEIHRYMLDLIASEPAGKKERLHGMGVWSGIYKREVIENTPPIRFFSERDVVSEDLLFNVMFLQKARCLCNMSESFYFYCHNTSSLTRGDFNPQTVDRLKKQHGVLSSCLRGCSEASFRIDRFYVGMLCSYIQKIAASKDTKTKKSALDDVLNNDFIHEVVKRYATFTMPIQRKMYSLFILKKKRILLLFFAMAYRLMKEILNKD